MSVTQSCLTLCHPMDCSPSGSSFHGILQAGILEWVAISFSRGSSRPREHCRQILYHPSQVSENESRSVVSNSLQPHGLYNPWNSPGQNTGMGGLSLLQGIFPTQESNWGLLHCRQILYQLSYQGSPRLSYNVFGVSRFQTSASCCLWSFNVTTHSY